MKWWLIALALPWLTSAQPAGATADHEPFDHILRAVVRDERVDYALLRRHHLPALNRYLDDLATQPPGAGDESLAYHLNLYNATVLKAVAERYRPDYSVAEDDFRLFKEPIVRLPGKTISLDELEKKLILPTFKDPRVHVGLVCAAESCPPLLPRAYRADDVDRVLEENMKRFVNDASRNPIDVKNRKLVVSKIFDWYADDFGGKGNIDQYIDRYHPADSTGWPVSFVEYSWKLNDASATD